MKGREDLVDSYTTEVIEIELVLNCFYAEMEWHGNPEAHAILATSILKFIQGIHTQTSLYTTKAFNDFIWAFQDGRLVDCWNVARDVLFNRMQPGATGTPPETSKELTMRMIDELEHTTNESKDRWVGHLDIPPRVFGPE